MLGILKLGNLFTQPSSCKVTIIISLVFLCVLSESQVHGAEQFEWLTREHLCVLVYLVWMCFCSCLFELLVWYLKKKICAKYENPLFQVTVMHSMYAGYMEKAIRYSEKALVQVDRLQGT